MLMRQGCPGAEAEPLPRQAWRGLQWREAEAWGSVLGLQAARCDRADVGLVSEEPTGLWPPHAPLPPELRLQAACGAVLSQPPSRRCSSTGCP